MINPKTEEVKTVPKQTIEDIQKIPSECMASRDGLYFSEIGYSRYCALFSDPAPCNGTPKEKAKCPIWKGEKIVDKYGLEGDL